MMPNSCTPLLLFCSVKRLKASKAYMVLKVFEIFNDSDNNKN